MFLGFDVGGSQCRYEWRPAAASRGGDAVAVQPAVQGIEAAASGLAAALRQATATNVPDAAVCALAGIGERARADELVQGLRARGIAFPVAVVGDVLAAAAAGLADGPGVLVWSGTGSFAIARGADGALHRVGGRGYLLGDQGSAFDLVRRAAVAVLCEVDGLGPPTALTTALVDAFAASGPARLGAVLQRLSPGDVASRLGIVLRAAASGDAVALDVVASGVEALAMLANAAVRAASLAFRDLPVALGGGVLTGAPSVADALSARLQTFGAASPRTIEPRAAAHGAAWLAEGWHLGHEPQRSWVERVAI